MTWKPMPPDPKKRLTRDEKKRQTRARLLEAAQALFAVKGFEGTTIDDIATTAGFTRGAFYANFENKTAVMKVLISQGFEGDTSALDLFSGDLSVDDLAAAYQEYSQRFVDDPESLMWVLEFQMAAIRYPELREEYNRQYSALVGGVEELVREFLPATKQDGHVLARTVAEVLVTIQSALSVQLLLRPDQVPAGSFGRIMSALLRGVRYDDEKTLP